MKIRNLLIFFILLLTGGRACLGADETVKLEVNINKKIVYIHQPFIYTEKLITKVWPFYNLNIPKLQINDALVEQLHQAQYNEIYNDEQVAVYEFNYLITPLNTGTMLIPPLRITGEVRADSSKNHDPFGNFFAGTIFGQNTFKSFILNSDAIKVTVLSAIEDEKNWLPLEEFIIQDLSNIPLANKVGEPITRILKMSSVGATAKSLPSLEKFNAVEDIKVYAGQPILKTNYDPQSKKITSSKEETYTLIPEKAGTVILPEISIAWWDINLNKMQTFTLPAKEIQVLPAAATFAQDNNSYTNEISTEETNNTLPQNSVTKYIIISLVILILILITIILYLIFGKNNKNVISQTKLRSYSKLANSITALNTLPEIYKFIQNFAVDNWQVPKNMSLKNIIIFLEQHKYRGNLPLLKELFNSLSTAVYHKNNLDINKLKQDLIVELPKIAKGKENKLSSFNNLNPT